MNRYELIRSQFDRTMSLIELGASYNPVIPKSEGWRTTIIDHANQADLAALYSGMGMKDVDRIEPVDYVWQNGSLTDLIPPHLHGTFDGLVASHVGEHFPDLIAFLQSASVLLKPDAIMALALPDKRVCFDFFQPLTMAGDLIDAHSQRRTRHQRRTFFNQAAYFTTRNTNGGWAHNGETAPFHLANPLIKAQRDYNAANEDIASTYIDTHAWAFTPKSFELLMLELNLLGHIDWAVRSIEPAPGIEFYVWLEQRRVVMADAEVNPARLSLLTAMVQENADAIAQIDAVTTTAPVVVSKPSNTPSITAVIPLYNGSRYIEEAVNSVIKQSLRATEIIVVDDGSTDDGAGVAIVERMARSYPITLLHKPNGGQSSARNLGVQEAKTDLVAFLDQDDVWYETHLEDLGKPFEAHTSPPLGWVYSNLDEIDEDGFLVSRSYLSTLSAPHPKRHIFECIREDMFVLPSASLIRRDAFLSVGGFDERLCGYEDDDLFMRLFRAGYDNIYLDKALSKWRIYPGSTSYTFRMAVSRGIYARKLLEMFPDDVNRMRYHTRDMIVPRFFDHAIQEYENAIKLGDPEAIAATWNEVTFLARYNVNVAPRLFKHALGHYRGALIEGDNATITAAWNEVSEVAARIPKKSRRVRTALNLLRNPTVSKSVFAIRRVARPAMLWAFSA
jgi:glycosyltransferase involved in cell wall biosynthesis